MGRETRPSASISRDQMVKPVDAWWTVLLVDPIATRAIPPLARRTWATPTRITVLAHLLGIVSAVLYATELLVLAAIVFELRFVADCIDGKLARATGRSSLLGQVLDTVGDRVLLVVNVAALGWRYEPAAVALFGAAYMLHFHLLETRHELAGRGGSAHDVSGAGAGGWRGALARRRLYPIPSSVDAEHVLLVVGPLLWAAGVDAIGALLWVVTAYFVLQCLRYGAGILRTAAELDRQRPLAR